MARTLRVSLMHWKSVKHTRKASSPRLCKTHAASDALVEGAWVKCLMEAMGWSDFDIVLKRRRSVPRPLPRPHVLLEELS